MTVGLPVPRDSRYILRPPISTSPAKSGCDVGVTGGTVVCTCALLPHALSARNSAVAASDFQRNRLNKCIGISKLWQKRNQKSVAIWASTPSVQSAGLPGGGDPNKLTMKKSVLLSCVLALLLMTGLGGCEKKRGDAV